MASLIYQLIGKPATLFIGDQFYEGAITQTDDWGFIKFYTNKKQHMVINKSMIIKIILDGEEKETKRSK